MTVAIEGVIETVVCMVVWTSVFDEGTPLLAIAAGEVIASGEGGRLEGFFIWLRHSPDDTDLPFWTYSKYQHLLKQVRTSDRSSY